MQRQLALIDREPDWRLDERTKAIGRQGLKQAREALQQARAARLAAETDVDATDSPALEQPASTPAAKSKPRVSGNRHDTAAAAA